MASEVTLRTDAGDEYLTIDEFEGRVRRGEVSPQSLVKVEALTGRAFVRAHELQLFNTLHEPRRANFTRAFSVSRFPWLTSAVILLQVAVFLLTARNGGLHIDDMIRFGAKVRPLVFDVGEAWRLFTANFLHHDAVHLGVNMFVLFNVGGALENVYRALDYLWLLVLAGVVTMATSLALNDAITVGASGLVFGCLGGVVAFGLRYRSALPARYRSVMADAAVPTVLGLLLVGMTSRGVDTWAHLGGLTAGLGAGFTLRPRLLVDVAPGRWEPLLRAAPSLLLVAALVVAPALAGDVLPSLRVEHDDDSGLSVAVPAGWSRGPSALGSTAWYNGLSNAGRASISVDSLDWPEGADAMAALTLFVDEQLTPRSLGPEVTHVRHDPPTVVRVAERDAARVAAIVEDAGVVHRLVALFIPHGQTVHRVVFTWPAEWPAYARVAERMMGQLSLDEPRALRLARAQALLFPNAPLGLQALGETLLSDGAPGPAAEVLAQAVRVQASNVRARVLGARAWLAAGDVERGCAAARGAVAYAPEAAETLEVQARCSLASGDVAGALERLEAARAAAPDDVHLRDVERRLRALAPR